METLNCIKCKLQKLYSTSSTNTHWTPWRGDMALHKHSVFCSKTNQLWQPPCYKIYLFFNGYDTTHLEDWLVDIETAADLATESRAKLAQAKSTGLIHTLITEAIMLGNCWDDIKDLLQLKLCDTDIHTSISCFMEIQQWEKESLTAYIHWFKTEAKRCNFTNNAATIRIFIKGLKCSLLSHSHLWKGTTNTHQCYIWNWEAPDHTTTYNHINTTLNGKHYVSQGRSEVPGIRSYSTSLPQCLMFQVWWVWPHSDGLST